jgi:hypothetical protein
MNIHIDTQDFISSLIANNIPLPSEMFNSPVFKRRVKHLEGKVSATSLLDVYQDLQDYISLNKDEYNPLDCRNDLHVFAYRTQNIYKKFGKEYYIEKFGISDEGFLKFISDFNPGIIRITKSHSVGMQLHETVRCTPYVMDYITENFTTDEIIDNFELIPQSFLISHFCKREDFTSEKLLKLNRLIQESDMKCNIKYMILYDLCLFASHLKESTPSFDWNFAEKFRNENQSLFNGGLYSVI